MRAGRRDDKSALLHSALQSMLSETKPLMSPQESAQASLQRSANAHANTNGANGNGGDDGGRRVYVPGVSSGDNSIGSGSDHEGSHAGQSYRREQQSQQVGVKRQRVPTYYLRKKETKALQLQLQALQEQVKALKSASQQQQEEVRERPPQPEPLHSLTRKKQVENQMLCGTVQLQQLSFARMQSAFGRNLSAQAHIPFGSCIRLGHDWHERHTALLAMKDEKLESAQQYTTERMRFLDPCAPFTETSRFNSQAGDLHAIWFDVIPFEGIRSAQQVFDALLFYGLNMEISISEVLGDITIREDDEVREQGILHNRLLSSVRDVNVQVESNTVMFYKFYEGSEHFGGGREFGVIVADFVDEDELHPYSPATRLRHDVTAALIVTLEPHKTVDEFGEEHEEHIAVMTRSAFLKLHRTDLPLSPHVMQELHVRVEGWGDAMLKTLTGILYPDTYSTRDSNAPRIQRFMDA